MIAHGNGQPYECVLVDVNTQWDFCAADGAYPVRNLYELIPALRRAVAWAKWNHAPVISSIESHRPFEITDAAFPAYCVDGSRGQHKIEFTLFNRNARIEADNTLSCPIGTFSDYQQIIFRKRSDDLLANPKADRFFTQVPTDEFILVGVGVENAIKSLALGLLTREKRVSVVVDASGYWDKGTADLAIQQVIAKGGRVMSIDQLLDRKLNRTHRYSGPLAAPQNNPNGNGKSGNGRKNGH